MAQELKSKYPQYKFIGEESDVNEPLTDHPTFICDPIDGTMNFVHGHPYVSISLGFAYKLRPVVGVVYNPFYHHLYTAALGRGAYFEDFRSKHRLPFTSLAPPLGGLRGSLVLVEWGKEREGINWETAVDTFKNLTAKDGGMVHDLRTFGGAALNLCTVAAGSVDMAWGGGWEAWDVCAGWAVLLEAGGRMFNGNPLEGFDEPPVDGKMYLAGKSTHPSLACFVPFPLPHFSVKIAFSRCSCLIVRSGYWLSPFHVCSPWSIEWAGGTRGGVLASGWRTTEEMDL